MDYRDLRSTLLSKGGTEQDRSKDHVFYFLELEGSSHRVTKISHGAKGQIPNDLLSMIARQMRLTAPELRKFVKCTLTTGEWHSRWQE